MATGIAFPLETVDGNLVIATDAALVRCHVLASLQTQVGERLGLRWFGLPDYTFRSYGDFLGVGGDVQAKMLRMVPQAGFAVTSSLNDDGEGDLQVDWTYQQEKQESIVATTGSAA